METNKNNNLTLRKPYEIMVNKAKSSGRYKVIDGVKLEKARHRINSSADENIARIENLERIARIKSASWIIK